MINCRVTFTLLFLCLYYIVHMLFAGFDVTNGMCIFDVTQSHILTSDQTMQCVLSVQRSRQFYSSFHRVDISPCSFSPTLLPFFFIYFYSFFIIIISESSMGRFEKFLAIILVNIIYLLDFCSVLS